VNQTRLQSLPYDAFRREHARLLDRKLGLLLLPSRTPMQDRLLEALQASVDRGIEELCRRHAEDTERPACGRIASAEESDVGVSAIVDRVFATVLGVV
jgi:hypothetical protein